MTKPKVSVIMPVFNTEQYVNEALMSIIEQTLKDIEIIVINDGSTDNSLQIITDIAEKDNRIQIYSQENQGLSVSRDVGINKALGEFIYFMDSDDLLDLDALECCYNKCVAEDLDFVFFDADIIFENKEFSLAFDYHRSKIEEKVYNGLKLLNELIDKNIYRAPVWMNFIRLSYLIRINLNFYPRIIHEDELFSAILYIEAERVGRIDKDFFKRRIRENSIITKQFSWKNATGYMTVFAQLKLYSNEKNVQIKDAITKLIIAIINPFFYNARTLALKERIKILISCIQYDYIKNVRIKNIIVLLFPSIIKVKSFFNKFRN